MKCLAKFYLNIKFYGTNGPLLVLTGNEQVLGHENMVMMQLPFKIPVLGRNVSN